MPLKPEIIRLLSLEPGEKLRFYWRGWWDGKDHTFFWLTDRRVVVLQLTSERRILGRPKPEALAQEPGAWSRLTSVRLEGIPPLTVPAPSPSHYVVIAGFKSELGPGVDALVVARQEKLRLLGGADVVNPVESKGRRASGPTKQAAGGPRVSGVAGGIGTAFLFIGILAIGYGAVTYDLSLTNICIGNNGFGYNCPNYAMMDEGVAELVLGLILFVLGVVLAVYGYRRRK